MLTVLVVENDTACGVMEDLLLLLLLLLLLAICCLWGHEKWRFTTTSFITDHQIVFILVAIVELGPIRLRTSQVFMCTSYCQTLIKLC